jgi:RNA recognition motif-containing protein
MSKKLFVGGLSWGTNENSLQQAFEGFGDIEEAKVIMDRETGRSRGFGFVTFTNNQDAIKAISEMDGSELEGRNIKVNEAREQQHTSRNGDGGGGYRSGGGANRGGGSRW